MVKRRRVAAPRPLALAAALAAVTLAPAARADWTVRPSVQLRETYSDNVALSNDATKQDGFVTELNPRINLLHKSRRLTAAIDYSKQLYTYTGGRREGTASDSQNLAASAKAELIDELLTVDAQAAIGQQSNSAFGPQVQGNGFANANRSEVRSFSVTPVLRHRFGTTAVTQLLYSRDRVESDNGAFGSSSGDTLQATIASGAAFRQFGWSLSYSDQTIQDSIAQGSSSDNLSATLSYRYSPLLTLSVTGGREHYQFDGQAADDNSGQYWNLGFNWVPSGRTEIQFNAGRRQFGDTYFLNATHRSRHSVWSANYSDSITTTRSEFLQSGRIDTASLLDRLFIASVPDAAARAQVVAAYIRANGLPPTLPNSVNYLSNRYVLQHQFQLAVAFSSARTTLLLSVYDNRRDALSRVAVDDDLLGLSGGTINDNTRQSGVNAGLNWRMSPRSGINLNTTYAKVRSVSDLREENNRSVSLNMTHQFQPLLTGTLEVRHYRGGAGLLGAPGNSGAFNAGAYTENAVSASLTKTF